jgi:hypothetical protein
LNAAAFTFAQEMAAAADAPVDFCLWAYDPPQPVRPGSLRGVNLLYAAAELTGCLDPYRRVATSLRTSLGPFRTVWGVKMNGEALSTEFYFYDYERVDRAAPFARIAAAFAPVAAVIAPVDDATPYFMTSIELPMTPDALPARVDRADVYIGNPGSGVSSGICYEAGPGGMELKNFYFFFDAQSDWDSVVAKAGCSVHVPFGSLTPEALFPDWLRGARVAVIANKRHYDSVYFSGIGVEALIRFLRHFGYPGALIGYAEANAAGFAHLQFDVGFDYRVEAGRLITAKSSFYNVL